MDDLFEYPPVSFHFKVTFNGDGVSGETSFKEVSGLTVEMSYEEIAEGGELRFRHRLPTVPKFSNLILKRGLIVDSNLRKWLEKTFKEFVFTPLMVTIELLNEEQAPLMTWVAHDARPVKWEVSNFDAMNNELALETLELAYNYFETKT